MSNKLTSKLQILKYLLFSEFMLKISKGNLFSSRLIETCFFGCLLVFVDFTISMYFGDKTGSIKMHNCLKGVPLVHWTDFGCPKVNFTCPKIFTGIKVNNKISLKNVEIV